MIDFAPSPAWTVGIEEELLVVDQVTLGLAPAAADLLGRMEVEEGRAGSEAYATQIELRSGRAASSAAAVADLRDAVRAAIDAGATLMGAGLHPTSSYGEAPLSTDERYRDVYDSVRGLVRRTPESALHVHVGMPDPESAVRAYNGLRAHVPLLIALGANSPWWFGVDSGLASARYAVTRAYPGRGVPPALADWEAWNEHMDAVVTAAGVEDYTFVWPDLRLHPRHGTVEVREMDAQASLDDVQALTALVRALAREAAEREGAPGGSDGSSEALGWSSFRAARDGLDATVVHDGSMQPMRAVVAAAVERVRDIASELGDEDALLGVLDVVDRGGGAARQRRAYAERGISGLLGSVVLRSG